VKIPFPFASGQWRLQMGLAPLDSAEWFLIDENYHDHLAEKKRLLTEHYPEVFVALPGSEAEQQLTLEKILEYLAYQFPEHFRLHHHSVENQLTGEVFDLHTMPPLELAGRLVQEDLCLLRPSDNGFLLIAAHVCFPSRWRPSEKLGFPVAMIHAPVPGYQKQLEGSVNRFFDHLSQPMWRANWSIADSPALFLPPTDQSESLEIDSTNAGDRLWIRIERQTLSPIANNILFTIRTSIFPLSWIAMQPQLASGLRETLRQMPIETQHYKGLHSYRDAVIEYLFQF
jgi:dimethylamine monooxygenase subunit A